MSRLGTFEWFLRFRNDLTSVDLEHSGHPLWSQTDENVEKMCISFMGKDGMQLKMSIPFYTNHMLHASAF
jgi:hypothetical protein